MKIEKAIFALERALYNRAKTAGKPLAFLLTEKGIDDDENDSISDFAYDLSKDILSDMLKGPWVSETEGVQDFEAQDLEYVGRSKWGPQTAYVDYAYITGPENATTKVVKRYSQRDLLKMAERKLDRDLVDKLRSILDDRLLTALAAEIGSNFVDEVGDLKENDFPRGSFDDVEEKVSDAAVLEKVTADDEDVARQNIAYGATLRFTEPDSDWYLKSGDLYFELFAYFSVTLGIS